MARLAYLVAVGVCLGIMYSVANAVEIPGSLIVAIGYAYLAVKL